MPPKPAWAVSAEVTSVVAEDLRVCVAISNVANEEAVDVGLSLWIRVIFNQPELADDVIVETVRDGEIVPIPIINGFIQIDEVEPNTTIPVFATFTEEDTYVITIELFDLDSGGILARDVEVAVVVAVQLPCENNN